MFDNEIMALKKSHQTVENPENLKWGVKKRIQEIEQLIFWTGRLRRGDLIKKFGISQQQASADISLYQKFAPDNIKFNKSTKQYEPSKLFTPILIEPTLSEYIVWETESIITIRKIATPVRTITSDNFYQITRAIHQEKSTDIQYQSLTTPQSTSRRITPHTIVFDGYRYHVRAYCHLRNDFRDFVLSRIATAKNLHEPGLTKYDDDEWNTLVNLVIVPHPELLTQQRLMIEQEFNMINGELTLSVSQALLIYTLTQLRFDKFTQTRTPAEQQILLQNTDAVFNLVYGDTNKIKLKNTIDENKEHGNTTDIQLANSQVDNSKFTESNRSLMEKLNEEKEKNLSYKMKNESLDVRIEDRNAEIKRIRQDHSKQIDALEKKLTEAQRENKTLRIKHSSLEYNYAKLESERDTLIKNTFNKEH